MKLLLESLFAWIYFFAVQNLSFLFAIHIDMCIFKEKKNGKIMTFTKLFHLRSFFNRKHRFCWIRNDWNKNKKIFVFFCLAFPFLSLLLSCNSFIHSRNSLCTDFDFYFCRCTKLSFQNLSLCVCEQSTIKSLFFCFVYFENIKSTFAFIGILNNNSMSVCITCIVLLYVIFIHFLYICFSSSHTQRICSRSIKGIRFHINHFLKRQWLSLFGNIQ